jgi:ABC-type polysaccharide/polyol phosphate export permease
LLVIGISGVGFSWLIVFLPIILLFHLLFMLGVALFLSSAVVYLRDLTQIIDVLLTAWFFLTPIIYVMDQVYKDAAQIMYWVNPIASFIESYRAILFFHYPPDLFFTLRTCITGIITFLLGYIFFLKTTRSLGEVL